MVAPITTTTVLLYQNNNIINNNNNNNNNALFELEMHLQVGPERLVGGMVGGSDRGDSAKVIARQPLLYMMMMIMMMMMM